MPIRRKNFPVPDPKPETDRQREKERKREREKESGIKRKLSLAAGEEGCSQKNRRSPAISRRRGDGAKKTQDRTTDGNLDESMNSGNKLLADGTRMWNRWR
ncbi:hypothetical protein EVAR_27624_1 [Eumeta japonica]|uniref:Uncharacterized protein n=1 Tax=Eumeta variegata TaxID=151549 RepID=A0A4C1V111_EUMVA|nr:hypothetical protein EVAR_27624_1 [Eumeta japonica]